MPPEELHELAVKVSAEGTEEATRQLDSVDESFASTADNAEAQAGRLESVIGSLRSTFQQALSVSLPSLPSIGRRGGGGSGGGVSDESVDVQRQQVDLLEDIKDALEKSGFSQAAGRGGPGGAGRLRSLLPISIAGGAGGAIGGGLLGGLLGGGAAGGVFGALGGGLIAGGLAFGGLGLMTFVLDQLSQQFPENFRPRTGTPRERLPPEADDVMDPTDFGTGGLEPGEGDGIDFSGLLDDIVSGVQGFVDSLINPDAIQEQAERTPFFNFLSGKAAFPGGPTQGPLSEIGSAFDRFIPTPRSGPEGRRLFRSMDPSLTGDRPPSSRENRRLFRSFDPSISGDRPPSSQENRRRFTQIDVTAEARVENETTVDEREIQRVADEKVQELAEELRQKLRSEDSGFIPTTGTGL